MSDKPQVKLIIDDIEVSVPAGTTILKASQKLSKEIPHFCYHDGLPIVGQCRMCYVEIEGQKKLATSCSTTVTEGMKVKTDSPAVKQGQNSTLEFVLLDHPLDCPICDRGGECKLQDYTYEHGPSRSRMIDQKELLLKHHPISEEVVLDQERCILCTRCVRFSSHVDGLSELVVNERGSHSVINVFEDRPMQSKFSGNVVDLCPVGALTAQDFRFKARPWELRKHSGICTGCSVGCNIEMHTKHRHPGIPRPDGNQPKPKIERLIPRENVLVNDWWMCDRGRWGYHFHNEDNTHLADPMLRRKKGSHLEKVSLKEIQLVLEETSKSQTWEFWISDEASHEEISWAKSLQQSWSDRGRNVEMRLNPTEFSPKLLAALDVRKESPWFSGEVRLDGLTTIVSTYDSYRALEDIVPILALKLGQKIRLEGLKWVVRSAESMYDAKDDLATTAYLVPVPKRDADITALAKIPASAKALVLWGAVNSRGLANEGIAPLQALHTALESAAPRGPVAVFGQTTQNAKNTALTEYLKKAPFVLLVDSYSSAWSELANVVLPVEPLYESDMMVTNLFNMKQESRGIQIHHPNHVSIRRGTPSPVNPSLRLI
ncbi:MAG: 2Fe-2S iron-sulfur cluster-binding protein [Bdellovibrionota bacterium]